MSHAISSKPATPIESIARSAAPTFTVSDVAATARWYTEQLGFRVAGTFPKSTPWSFASLMLGSAEIMLVRLDGYSRPSSEAQRPDWIWDAYVRMDGVHAYYQRLSGREFIIAALAKKRHGDWEFDVRDPNGYVIVFGGDENVPLPG